MHMVRNVDTCKHFVLELSNRYTYGSNCGTHPAQALGRVDALGGLVAQQFPQGLRQHGHRVALAVAAAEGKQDKKRRGG